MSTIYLIPLQTFGTKKKLFLLKNTIKVEMKTNSLLHSVRKKYNNLLVLQVGGMKDLYEEARRSTPYKMGDKDVIV